MSQQVMDLFSSRKATLGTEVAKMAEAYRRKYGHEPSKRTLWLMGQQAAAMTRRPKSAARRVHGTSGEDADDEERLAAWEAQTAEREMTVLSQVHTDVAGFGSRPAEVIDDDVKAMAARAAPTFAMAALAGIGAMPDTIEDRAVVIRMRRRAPGESVAPFRHRRDRPALTSIAAQLDRWLGRHLTELEKAEPPMPLEDRAADTWEPLIAVADLAGGPWPALARHAAIVLTADHDQAASVSDRIRLLTDCRAAFGGTEALPTTTLITRLRSDPEAPWSEHGPGGITPMRLGAMLRDYDIRSGNIRFGEPIGQVKGYYRADFADAWARYCPSARGEPSQPSQPSPPSSAPGRLETWDGSSRPTQKAVPGLTCDGTTGTATPRFDVINGGAA